MNFKKNLFTIIFVILVVALVLMVIFILPPKKENSISSSSIKSSSSLTTDISVNELISLCDTVVSAKVIKADISADGVLYTLQIKTVFKGRNYTSMGYAYLKGKQTLVLAEDYLFFGATGEEKYHYFEPFENAPWVYKIRDDAVYESMILNKEYYVMDILDKKLDDIKDACE